MHSIDEKWLKSEHYKFAKETWNDLLRTRLPSDTFEQSQEFRDARLAFRRDVNQSWGMEST
jgi:hypothetical protein